MQFGKRYYICIRKVITMKTQLLTFNVWGTSKLGSWTFKKKATCFLDCFNRLSKKHKMQCDEISLCDGTFPSESMDSELLMQLQESL